MYNSEDEKFLSRWSRLKRDTKVAQPDGVAQAKQADQPAAAALTQQHENAKRSESVPPPLPPVDELTMDSDFRSFFHPKVDEGMKRAALKKLLSDPHFSVMDGLDIYLDDYSISDPLPPEMLAQMRSAQKIFKWARNELEEGETAPVQIATGDMPELESPLPVPAGEGAPVTEQLAVVTQVVASDTVKLPEAAEAALPASDDNQ